MKLLKLVAEHVQADEPLPFDVRDAQGRLLLARGHRFSGAAQRDALIERGVFADEDEFRAVERRRRGAADESAAATAGPPTLFGAWERALWRVHDFTRRPPDLPGFAAGVVDETARLRRLVDADADAAIYLCVRQDPSRFGMYGWAHAIHTAVLCLLIARRLGWRDAAVQRLMCAALTMNLGTLELQGRMAAQADPPTATQRAQIEGHAERAVQALADRGVDDADWLDTVRWHHGRPAGVAAGAADADAAQVLQLADVFLAKISPRLHRPPMAIQQAARQAFQSDRGGAVGAAVVKEFGIYPPGEYVRLKSGEFALVTHRAASAGTPRVAAITNARGELVAATTPRDTARPEFAIAAVEPAGPAVHRVPPERLYGALPAPA
jgi:hypothetical protein